MCVYLYVHAQKNRRTESVAENRVFEKKTMINTGEKNNVWNKLPRQIKTS